jgi:hypothetical protein
MLPDHALLEIFDFYRINRSRIQWWSLPVHICRRWRQIIFESPLRLNLQILCTHLTPVKKYLGIWPAFPIVIDYPPRMPTTTRADNVEKNNIIAALKHPSRISFIRLHVFGIYGTLAKNILKAMEEPFPVLTHLEIDLDLEREPVIPAEFLGGSAPRLQEIILSSFPYPILPTLLLSTTDLIKLDISDIPPNGYISPEAVAASLVALPRLETFVIVFQWGTSLPDRIHNLPVLTRSVLPALTHFRFKGSWEYLEELVSRIDGPRLNQIVVTYLDDWQGVDFQVVQFSKFIHRTVGPEISLFRHAQFSFSDGTIAFTMYPHANHSSWDRRPATTIISCEGINFQAQVLHITQVLSHLSAKLSNVAHLKLKAELEGRQLTGSDNFEWMRLLRQFSTVQTLHVSQELAGHVALALENATVEVADEVLPSLNLIRGVGQPASSIEKFIVSRRISGCPVTFVDTEAEFDKRLESYVSS